MLYDQSIDRAFLKLFNIYKKTEGERMKNTAPKTVSFSGEALLGMKKENKIPKEALNALREKAEGA
jgi:hypothetical protein